MKKSAKLACHVVNSNITIGSLPTLQTSHGLLALFEKIYYGDPIFTVISNNGEDVHCTIPIFQLSVWCERWVAARHNRVIGNHLLFANNRNRVRWVVLCLSHDGACTDSFTTFRKISLKGDLSNDVTLNPPLFSLVNTFKAANPLIYCIDIQCRLITGLLCSCSVSLCSNWRHCLVSL